MPAACRTPASAEATRFVGGEVFAGYSQVQVFEAAYRPRLRVLPDHRDIHVEVIVDYGLTDIVAERFDAGVRLGEQIAKDMIAVRIGPDMRMAVVGSPAYFERRELHVHVEGQLVFNNIALRMNAALAGLGLAYLPEDQVQAHIAAGRLVRVLTDWCPSFSGYHLYYPSRRQSSSAFVFVVDALRYRR